MVIHSVVSIDILSSVGVPPFYSPRGHHKNGRDKLHSVGLVQLEEHANRYLPTTSPTRGGASLSHACR
jgi:hypothetical protein